MVVKEQGQIAIIAGAAGQDGYFLTERLLGDGWLVHATIRPGRIPNFEHLPGDLRSRLRVHQIDLLSPQPMIDLISTVQPDEFYTRFGS